MKKSGMAELDDNSLLQAIATQRDRAAFTTLCERYKDRAFSFAVRILRNSHRAEDAVQDAMLAIWLTPAASLPQGNAENWIMGIIIHKSIDLKRSRAQSARREERAGSERSKAQPAPADSAANEELLAAMRKHLDQLPELECGLLTCCYGANMTHQSIAEAYRLPRSSVSEKIQKALARLRSEMTRAGFAAALPLGSTEALSEAMRGGYTCPPGVTEGILGRLDGVGQFAAKEVSRRAVGVARHTASGSWGVALGGAVAIAAAATVYALSGSKPVPAKVTLAPTPPAVAQPAPPKPTEMKWDFDQALAAEFAPRGGFVKDELRGTWPLPRQIPDSSTRAGVRVEPNRSGALEFPATGASLFLKTPVPARLPIRFSFDLMVLDPRAMSVGIWSGRPRGVEGRAEAILKYEKKTEARSWSAGWIHVVRSVIEKDGIVITHTTYDDIQRGDYLEEKKHPAWTDPKAEEFFEIYGQNFLIDNLHITYGEK